MNRPRTIKWIPVLATALVVFAGLRTRPAPVGLRLASARTRVGRLLPGPPPGAAAVDRADSLDTAASRVPAAVLSAPVAATGLAFRGFVPIAGRVLAGSEPPPSFLLQRPPPSPA